MPMPRQKRQKAITATTPTPAAHRGKGLREGVGRRLESHQSINIWVTLEDCQWVFP